MILDGDARTGLNVLKGCGEWNEISKIKRMAAQMEGKGWYGAREREDGGLQVEIWISPSPSTTKGTSLSCRKTSTTTPIRNNGDKVHLSEELHQSKHMAQVKNKSKSVRMRRRRRAQ